MMRNACKVLIRKAEGRRTLEDLEANVKRVLEWILQI
jgi:hypothetical protein